MTTHNQKALERMNHTATPEVAQLVAYLRSHGVTVLSSTDTAITVEGVYARSFSLENGSRMYTTETTIKVEMLPVSYTAIRNWLGY